MSNRRRALFLVSVAALAGCGKQEKSETQAVPSSTAQVVAEVPVPVAVAPSAAASAAAPSSSAPDPVAAASAASAAPARTLSIPMRGQAGRGTNLRGKVNAEPAGAAPEIGVA